MMTSSSPRSFNEAKYSTKMSFIVAEDSSRKRKMAYVEPDWIDYFKAWNLDLMLRRSP